MTEEINHSYDGGLYAELIRNRNFRDNATDPAHWSLVQDGGTGAIALDTSQPLSAALPVSLRLTVAAAPNGRRVGVANEGYWGVPVQPNTTYRASFFARGDGGTGPLTVSLESADGATVYAAAQVSAPGTGWKQQTVTLRTARVAPALRPIRDHGLASRHGLAQPRVPVPSDLQEPAQWLPARPDGKAGRHAARLPAHAWRQLCRGRHRRRPL